MKLRKRIKNINYNDIPVHYCTNCNSLHIKILENTNISYCVDCGNTEMEKSHIETYLRKINKINKLTTTEDDISNIINDIKNNK